LIAIGQVSKAQTSWVSRLSK